MATEYTDYFDPEDTGVGYFKYTLSPESGQAIAPGETVTISGTVRWNRYAIRSVSIFLWNNSQDAWSATVPVSIAKGTAGKFSIQFAAPDELFDRFTGRTCVTPYDDYRGINPMLNVCVASDPQGFDEMQFAIMSAPLLFLRYRLTPQILAMDFERATASGAWADDGQYLQCKALKLSINSQAVVDDITTAKLTCTGSDGSSREVFLTREQLEAALSPEGYVESRPGIFAGFTSALGVTYTLTLTVGDEYDQTSLADTVMRSFARLHLSGAKNGGVAVGMFSSATDDQPKFEVSENHSVHFYSMPGAMILIDVVRVVWSAGSVANNGSKIGEVALPEVDGADEYILLEGYAPAWLAYGGAQIVGEPGNRKVRIKALNFSGAAHSNQVIVYVGAFKRIAPAAAVQRVVRPFHAMASNSDQKLVASASSVNTSGQEAWHAFNFNEADFWASKTGDAEPWLQLQLDVALRDIVVEVYARNNATPKSPTSGRVALSNDGAEWNQAATYSGWDGDTPSILLGKVECHNATPYSYVRLEIDRIVSGLNYCVGYVLVRGILDHYTDAWDI